MKLKRVIASLTAAAMVVSLTVSPVSVGAESTELSKMSFTSFGAAGSDWNQADFVSNASAEMSEADLTGLSSIKFIASANDLNYGWNNGQFYTNSDAEKGGAGWKTKSFGGSEGTYDVSLASSGIFEVSVDAGIDSDGYWAAGWGTSSGNTAFGIYGLEFYAGSTKLGTWADSEWYDSSYDLLLPYEFGSSTKDTWAQGDILTNETAELAGSDFSKLTSVKICAEARYLNDGWNNGQFYTNSEDTYGGTGWVAKSYGGSKSTHDVALSSAGTFTVDLDLTPGTDGYWAVGWGTGCTKGMFDVLYIDFMAGDSKIGTWADGIWFPTDVPATGITVSPETASVKIGSSIQLSAVLEPAGATSKVTWSSDDTAVATVDSTGKVTGVAEGTVTITAAVSDTIKASAQVTVTTNKTIITPVVTLPSSITVYTTNTTEQAKEVKSAAKISGIDKLASSDYTVTAVSDGAKGTVTFALTTTGSVKYKVADDAVVSASCTINFEQWVPTVYDGYSVSGPTELDVDYNADASVISDAVTTAIKSQTITLSLIESESDHVPLPAKSLEDVIKSIGLPDTYDADSSVSVPVTIDLVNVMNEGDVYLGASGEELTELTVTYTVNVGPDSSTPEPEPDPDPEPDPEPTPEPAPVPYVPGAAENDITKSYPSNGSTTTSHSPYTSGAVSTSAAAGVIRIAGAGDTVTIIMDEDIIPANLLEILADKNNVTAVFVYSGYSVSINSGDIDASEIADIDFSNKGRFLTDEELAMFEGAYVVRQLNFAHNGKFPGVSKVTVTVTMRGVSKDKDAAALLRTGEGEFTLVSDGTVGTDRTFSFELTHASKYVVYTGECSVAYAEDISSGAGLDAQTEETSSALPTVFAGIAVIAAAAAVIRKIRA